MLNFSFSRATLFITIIPVQTVDKKLSFVYPYQPYGMVYVSVRLFLKFAVTGSLKANTSSPSLPQGCEEVKMYHKMLWYDLT